MCITMRFVWFGLIQCILFFWYFLWYFFIWIHWHQEYILVITAPITAHIHRRQLGLFGMVCRLPNNILHKIASSILASEPDTSKSWFVHIRQLCLLYSLPSPLLLLQQPPSKCSFKSLIDSRILYLWQRNLRDEAQPKISLSYFNPSFMSLSNPHPVWTPSSTNEFETNKTVLQTAVLSGRYKSDYLSRYRLSNSNRC